ncbi:hypothetical protein DAMA08_019980 [Martiniozyma asiatica (nom. inval.)]|nr:hypothetical protein DAMA08_019980 [Martiniozyma asiatica]
MPRSFYQNDSTPSLPGLPEVALKDSPIEATTPISESHPSLDPPSASVISPSGHYITTTPALQSIASSVRQTTTDYYKVVSEKWEFYTSTAKAHWGMTVDRTKDLVDPSDAFLPNACYVLTGSLFGSIIARNRGLALRIATPWFAGLTVMKFALPGTFDNLSAIVGGKYLQVESEKAPQLKAAREEFSQGLKEFKKSGQDGKHNAWVGLVDTVHEARVAISRAFK